MLVVESVWDINGEIPWYNGTIPCIMGYNGKKKVNKYWTKSSESDDWIFIMKLKKSNLMRTNMSKALIIIIIEMM